VHEVLGKKSVTVDVQPGKKEELLLEF
jgi:hypothetical protein